MPTPGTRGGGGGGCDVANSLSTPTDVRSHFAFLRHGANWFRGRVSEHPRRGEGREGEREMPVAEKHDLASVRLFKHKFVKKSRPVRAHKTTPFIQLKYPKREITEMYLFIFLSLKRDNFPQLVFRMN